MADKVFAKVKYWLVAIQNIIVAKIVSFSYLKNVSFDLTRLGTDYGGWFIPKNILHAIDKKRVLVSGGLGHDVSFDKILLKNGFQIIGLDPLAECCDFARKELGDSKSVFVIEKGLWTNSGNIDFFPPKNKTHDSWSITNTQSALPQEGTTFKVISLEDLIKEYPSIGNSDFSMLKLDIEGAESEIMKKLFTSDYKFDFIGIEMDFLSLIPFLAIKRRLRAIFTARQNMKIFKSAGYTFVLKENLNFFWIKENY